ncbi:MAG: DUF721 domain-containing protein [Akkermansia sp.]|nr:DUF721 domain-containing protein [Akkermansia sp.]
MPRPRRKKDEKAEMPRPEVVQPRAPRRFVMQRMADGVSERTVRWRSRREGERDQAMADFFGSGPDLPVAANMRTAESLLGEVLASMQLEEETLSAELLAEAWQKAVGPALAALSQLVSVANKSACIRVAHPAARYELTRLRSRAIVALNQALGEGSVRTLRIIS